jgi:hypothetical protein
MDPPGLSKPARYFPIRNGRHEFSAGFSPLETSFGNGRPDLLHFQLDSQFDHHRKSKLSSRQEQLGKYYFPLIQDHGLRQKVVQWMISRLVIETPDYFTVSVDAEGGKVVHCRLTGEILILDGCGGYMTGGSVRPEYLDGVDALACQVQEDLAVMTMGDGTGKLVLLHLCFPNHWSGEEKIGRNFQEVHQPVAGFERLAQSAPQLMESVMDRGPYVRFAWGLTTDDELNRHPDRSPCGILPRRLDVVEGLDELYMRIERQVLAPLPGTDAFIFLIRTYFLNVAELDGDEQVELSSALVSMTQKQRIYKGLARGWERILELL